MNEDRANEVAGRVPVGAPSLLRANIQTVVALAAIMVMGMILLALSPPWDLVKSGWGLFLATLATLILGGILGYRVQQLGGDLPLKTLFGVAFGVAWRIGAIWIVLVGCVEYGMTSLSVSFPTTSATVDHYPIILVCILFIVTGSFLLGYATGGARGGLANLWHRDRWATFVGLVQVLIVLVPVGAGILLPEDTNGLHLTSKLEEYLHARLGRGSYSSEGWPRPILSKADRSQVQVTLWGLDDRPLPGCPYKLVWYVQKDPQQPNAAWPYPTEVSCGIRTGMLPVEKKWRSGARITCYVTPLNENAKMLPVRSNHYRFYRYETDWKVVYDAPRAPR